MATLPKSQPGKQRNASPSPVSAATAKTHLLALLDQVDHERTPITITKRGRPVARLEPIRSSPRKVEFGFLKGRIQIHGDIVAADPEPWDSDQ